jgi:hypothetical protein
MDIARPAVARTELKLTVAEALDMIALLAQKVQQVRAESIPATSTLAAVHTTSQQDFAGILCIEVR